MNYCPNCRADLEPGVNFCKRCGMPIQLTEEESDTMRLPPDTSPTEDAGTWRLPPEKRVTGDQQRPTMPVRDNPAPYPERPPNPNYAPPAGYYQPPQQPQPPPYAQPQYTQPPYAQPQYVQPQQPAPINPGTGYNNISLGDWLSGGWHLYKENAALMSLASFLGGLFSVLSIGILAGPLLMGLFRMAFKAMRGERPEMHDLFNWEGRFFQAFLAYLISAVIYGGLTGASKNGGLFAIVAFIVVPILTMLLGFTLPLILERKMDVAAAVNEVGRLIFSRDALMWWVVGLVFSTIAVGGTFACFVGIFVTMPWIVSSAAVAYRDIFGFDDPNRTLH